MALYKVLKSHSDLKKDEIVDLDYNAAREREEQGYIEFMPLTNAQIEKLVKEKRMSFLKDAEIRHLVELHIKKYTRFYQNFDRYKKTFNCKHCGKQHKIDTEVGQLHIRQFNLCQD